MVRVGDVDDQRLDTRRSDCVGVPIAPDTREDVEPAPASSRAVAAPIPVDAPVITAISWISGDAVTSMKLRWPPSKEPSQQSQAE